MNLQNIITEFDLKIMGVIHVGAHYGEELDVYDLIGIENIILFEPVWSNFNQLIGNMPYGSQALNIALGNATGTVNMYVETSNEGQSCSILEPMDHLKQYPNIVFNRKEIVNIDKLDNISFDRTKFNMINADVQGFELEVFKGASETLKTIDIIYTEVNRAELYKGCVMVEDIDLFLSTYNFKRVKTIWEGGSWGDALYLKSNDHI